MKHQKFSSLKRLQSFKYAFNGLKILFKEEHNARIHFLVGIGVVILSIFLKLNPYEWVAIIFSMGLVFTAEIINSAIEGISDFISPEKNEKIGKIKDLSAAAVLISAVTAFAVGLIVFLPKLRL